MGKRAGAISWHKLSVLGIEISAEITEIQGDRRFPAMAGGGLMALTMNQHPLHFDAAYASKSEFGRLVVNSCLTLSIVAGMSVSDISQKAIGNLGWNDIRLIAPVFVGDTIYAESEVLSKRELAKRPTQGIVTVKTTGKKADGTVFMTYERSVLVPKRGHAVDDRADY